MARNRYNEPPARAAECLRQALPLMTRQAAPPHPLSYAVWYEHVAGRNAALSNEIARLTVGEKPLDEEQTVRLFNTHVLDVDEQAAQRVAEGFRGILEEVGNSARQAGLHSEHFETVLARWHQAVESGEAVDVDRSAAMQADTRQMRAAVGAFQARLDDARSEVERLRRDLDRAREEAMRDALTGLANRRAFDERLAACLTDGSSQGCVLMTDIDHFKKVNDTYGHLFGDQVLRAVAQGVRACLSPGELAARIGGEEFAILLPGATLTQAQALAERVRATVAASRIKRRDGDTIGQVTVSLGVAARHRDESAHAWLDRADRALYAAKHAGRNRVTVAA
jgi:diguanylate cyclase